MRLGFTAALLCLALGHLSACAPGPANPFRTARPAPVGYGTPEEDTGTGAVGSMSSRDLEAGHFDDMAEFLQGRIAGLQVIRLANGDVTLRIRGVHQSLRNDAEPLLVVDLMPVANLSVALRGLRPKDVERVEVLKDVASTSVYGTRGAHGVILLRMKRD